MLDAVFLFKATNLFIVRHPPGVSSAVSGSDLRDHWFRVAGVDNIVIKHFIISISSSRFSPVNGLSKSVSFSRKDAREFIQPLQFFDILNGLQNFQRFAFQAFEIQPLSSKVIFIILRRRLEFFGEKRQGFAIVLDSFKSLTIILIYEVA